jgi:uncharacterized protein (TIGR02147 family)
MAREQRLSVFRFADYRAFLREYYAGRKAQDERFSHRVFARSAGFSSPNFLKLVMDGKRNLGPTSIAPFARACGLTGEAAEYFAELVAFNQARSRDERERHYRRLREFRGYRRVHMLEHAHAAYYAHWYIPAIRELAFSRTFEASPEWIAQQLLPRIGVQQAREALRVLEQLGMLVPDASGRLRPSEQLVAVPSPATISLHMANYHRAMMQRADAAIELVPRSERELAALTFCLSDARIEALKSELQRTRDRLLQRYGADAEGERVVQVNFQMFPLSKRG